MKVYMGNVPLTKEIENPTRCQLAYNMFYGMAQAGVLIDDDVTLLTTDNLHIMDSEGCEVKLELDKEWFGNEEDNLAAQEAVLDVEIKAMEKEGYTDIDRQYEKEMMEPYTISWRSFDNTRVWPLPSCWDIEKARAMYAVMNNDLEYYVRLYMNKDVGGLADLTYRDEQNENLFDVTNLDGDVYDETAENNDSFAKAIMNMPTDDRHLGQ